jgi:hypothetical protein
LQAITNSIVVKLCLGDGWVLWPVNLHLDAAPSHINFLWRDHFQADLVTDV